MHNLLIQASLSKLQSFRFEHRILQERQRELEVRRMQRVVHAQLLNQRTKPRSKIRQSVDHLKKRDSKGHSKGLGE